MASKDSCLLVFIPTSSPIPHWIRWPVWPLNYCGHNGAWLLRLGHKISCNFHLSLPWIIALGDAGCYVIRPLKQLYREADVARNWDFLNTTGLICQTCEGATLGVNPLAPDKPSHDIAALLNILTATLWGCPQKLCKTIKVNCCLSHYALW